MKVNPPGMNQNLWELGAVREINCQIKYRMPSSCTGQTPAEHSPSLFCSSHGTGSRYFYLLNLATLHGGGHLGFPDEAHGGLDRESGGRQSQANSLITVSRVTSQTESEEPRGARDLTGTQSLHSLNQDLAGRRRRGQGWRLIAEECDSLPRWVDPPDQMESGSPLPAGEPGTSSWAGPLTANTGKAC